MPDQDQCTPKAVAEGSAAEQKPDSKPFRKTCPSETRSGPEPPRERLLRAGPEALGDAELLGLIIPGGQTRRSHGEETDHAAALLERAGGLQALARLERRDRGPELDLDSEHEVPLLAVAELSRRLSKARIPEGEMLHRPELVAAYLRLRYETGDQEVMGALYVDANQRLLFEAEIFRGALRRAVVEPGPILRRALIARAPAFILFHTHPAGDPNPSPEDLAFTRRVGQAGATVGVFLLDHLIVGSSGRWRSMRREIRPWLWS